MVHLMWEFAARFFRVAKQQDGQDLVEYALLIALIVVVLVASVGGASSPLLAIYNHILALYP